MKLKDIVFKKTLYLFGRKPDLETLNEDELKSIYSTKNSVKLSKVIRKKINKIPLHLSIFMKKSFNIRKRRASSKISGYTSIVLAPENGKNVKTFRVSNLQIKTTASIVAIFLSLMVGISYITFTKAENMALEQSMKELNLKFYEQSIQMMDKLAVLDDLVVMYEDSEVEMDKFVSNYERIINKYLDGRVKVAVAARSGDREGTNFVNDISDLRVILQGLEGLSENQDETLADINQAKENLSSYLYSLPTLWPAEGPVSSGFGNRRDPFTRRISFHKGIDIAANYGTDILASGTGTIVFTGIYEELGKTIMIDHGNDLKTVYGHASSILVKNGDSVNKGDIIGKVGSTGRSTGAHLHFEIRINETPVDPDSFLDKE